MTLKGRVPSPSGFLCIANASTKPVEVGAYTTHKGKESPEKRTCDDMCQSGPGDREKVDAPGDEETPENNAGMPKKEQPLPVETHGKPSVFVPIVPWSGL